MRTADIRVMRGTEPAIRPVSVPKLRTIIPSHMRPERLPWSREARADRLGVGGLMFVPELRKVYEY